MRQYLLLLSIAVVTFLCGCGSSEESTQDWYATPDTSQARSSTFETSTDTINTQGSTVGSEATNTSGPGVVRFAVQIGSFKDAKNASMLQTSARQRLSLPVVNVYNAQGRLYQVRVGFFETEEQAIAYRVTLLPEYKDAWVVEINK